MKESVLRTVFLFIAIAAFNASAFADEAIKLGKWELTTSSDTQMSGPATTDAQVAYQKGQLATFTDAAGQTAQVPVDAGANLDSMKYNGQNGTEAMKSSDVQTICITDPNNPLVSFTKMPGCPDAQVTKSDNALDYVLTCAMEGTQVTINGHYVFAGEALNGSVKSDIGGIASQTKVTGRYVGACDGTSQGT